MAIGDYERLIEVGAESGALAIVDAAMKFRSVLETHNKALVSISGGADSDVMMDLCERVKHDTGCEVVYVWFDTGIEYDATKRHIEYLQERYDVPIQCHRAEKTIPRCCKEYGQPFYSKFVSECMERLQRHGFQWEDEPLDVLESRYPHTSSALKWWCNGYTRTDEPGYYDIDNAPYLKEFVMQNPPQFSISNKCCEYAKKRVSKSIIKQGEFDLRVIGIRKAEGGIRAKTKDARCFRAGPVDSYYPLFWFSDRDRGVYKELFNVRNSACYELWGFKRTGCIGCPYNRRNERDLQTSAVWEPGITAVARKVFAETYDYTRRYYAYRAKRRAEDKGQLVLPIEFNESERGGYGRPEL